MVLHVTGSECRFHVWGFLRRTACLLAQHLRVARTAMTSGTLLSTERIEKKKLVVVRVCPILHVDSLEQRPRQQSFSVPVLCDYSTTPSDVLPSPTAGNRRPQSRRHTGGGTMPTMSKSGRLPSQQSQHGITASNDTYSCCRRI